MEAKNTYLLHETEAFMRGELDNVTVLEGRILLDMVQGAYVPYGCYTSPAVSMPIFDMLRMSWNADTPAGTAVEAQARVLVDGNWSPWFSFGKWGAFIRRESARPLTRGAFTMDRDTLALNSKEGTQAQMRIYLYTKEEKLTPSVSLLGVSVRTVACIPAGGRPVNTQLHLIPYSIARRTALPQGVTGAGIGIASLVNRWGADLLPEELALITQDYADLAGVNLCFAAAAAGCYGFPAWVCWADLAQLRAELRSGNGAIAVLEATAAQAAAGLPAQRFVAVRGFAAGADGSQVLLDDPWAADTDFGAETAMPMDDFLVAWNNAAIFIHKRPRALPEGRPRRQSAAMRHTAAEGDGIYRFYQNGETISLPDDFCGSDAAPTGVLAWSTPDEHPHATTAHRHFNYCQPQQGGIQLAPIPGQLTKYTVYAIDYSGSMLVSDVMV